MFQKPSSLLKISSSFSVTERKKKPKPASKLPSRLRVTRHQPNISSSNGQREKQSSKRDKRTPRSLGYHTVPPPQRRHGKPNTTTTAPSLFLLCKLIHLSTLPRFLRGKKETAMKKNQYTKEEKKTESITVERCYLPSLSLNLRTSLAPSSQCADLRCDVRLAHTVSTSREAREGQEEGTTTLAETLTQGPT